MRMDGEETMRILIIGLVFWLCETAYYGFNARPCCDAEKNCDVIAIMLVFYGAGMMAGNSQRQKGKSL